MADKLLRADAVAVAKVFTITISGTLTAGDTITLTLKDAVSGGATVRSLTYTLPASPTLDIVSAGIAAKVTDAPEEEWRELTAVDVGSASGQVTLTQVSTYAGMPIFVEISDSSGSLTSAISTTTASSSPSDFGLAANWVGGSGPGTSDNIFLDTLANDVLWNLDAYSQVAIARIVNTKNIGLPLHNGRYREYRPRYLKALMSSLYINSPDANLLRIDLAALASVVEVIVDSVAVEGEEDGLEALCLKCSGSNGFNLTVNRGSVGVAAYESETAKVPTIVQNYRDNPSDTVIRCGKGATLTNVYRTGGEFHFASALTLLEQREKAGDAIFTGVGVTLATVTIYAGSLIMRPTATDPILTNITIGSDCELNLAGCAYPVKSPNTIIAHRGARIIDPFDRLCLALPTDGSPDPSIAVQPVGCNLEDVTIVRKTGKTYLKM